MAGWDAGVLEVLKHSRTKIIMKLTATDVHHGRFTRVLRLHYVYLESKP